MKQEVKSVLEKTAKTAGAVQHSDKNNILNLNQIFRIEASIDAYK